MQHKPFVLCLAGILLLAHGHLAAGEKKGQKLALLVGVRDYDHPEMRPLRYSENDVVELGKTLKDAGYDVTLLADGVGEKTPALSPSRGNIDKHLADVLAKCKRREDTIFLAFAGHGIQPEGDKDAYFCPKDANPKTDPKKTMLSLNKVYAALEESYAGVKVVLVDACRDDPKLARGRTGITGDSAPRPPRGVAVLFSCAAGEIAYEHEKYKHGVFFHHVLEGLRGKAKDSEDEITFTSLANYVARAVARDVPKLIGDGAQQSPNLKADLAGAPPVLATVTRSKPTTPEAPELKVTKPPPDAPELAHLKITNWIGLLGKASDGTEVAGLLRSLGKPTQSQKEDDGRVRECWDPQGLEIWFKGNKLDMIRFNSKRSMFSPFGESFAGKLPAGLSFSDTAADCTRKLGAPTEAALPLCARWRAHRILVFFDGGTGTIFNIQTE